jgi:hypothetical protein
LPPDLLTASTRPKPLLCAARWNQDGESLKRAGRALGF